MNFDDQVEEAHLHTLLVGCGPFFGTINPNSHDGHATIKKTITWCKKLLSRLMDRHLSDGDSPNDKAKLIIDVLEHALKLAKGEMKPFDPIP